MGETNLGIKNGNAENQRVYRSYFRGRYDVFARRWENIRTNDHGYSPVCNNEWIDGLCKKGKPGCWQCPNKSWTVLNEEWIQAHLLGTEVIGIYPLLKNGSCLLLALDFDKEGSLEEAFEFAETCRQEGVPVGVERSKSGKGAHAWMFLEEEVPAAVARRMGSYLIFRTEERLKRKFKSLDRMFPYQDEVRSGGVGNLIALPFQGRVTVLGNSVFIDREGRPYEDQWGYLQSLKKMSLRQVNALAALCPKDWQPSSRGAQKTIVGKFRRSPSQYFRNSPKKLK